MAVWFLCKIRYQKELENGTLKTINEAYLVDAMSFTEAEARLTHELSSTIREFEVINIARYRLADLFHYDDSEQWFKCKVVYISVDDRSGKEKKVNNIMLVSAATVMQAYQRIQESLKTMVVPYDITDVTTSAILEVFPYIPSGERDELQERRQQGQLLMPLSEAIKVDDSQVVSIEV